MDKSKRIVAEWRRRKIQPAIAELGKRSMARAAACRCLVLSFFVGAFVAQSAAFMPSFFLGSSFCKRVHPGAASYVKQRSNLAPPRSALLLRMMADAEGADGEDWRSFRAKLVAQEKRGNIEGSSPSVESTEQVDIAIPSFPTESCIPSCCRAAEIFATLKQSKQALLPGCFKGFTFYSSESLQCLKSAASRSN